MMTLFFTKFANQVLLFDIKISVHDFDVTQKRAFVISFQLCLSCKLNTLLRAVIFSICCSKM